MCQIYSLIDLDHALYFAWISCIYRSSGKFARHLLIIQLAFGPTTKKEPTDGRNCNYRLSRDRVIPTAKCEKLGDSFICANLC